MRTIFNDSAQQAEYDSNGYVVVDFLSPAEVETLQSAYDRLQADHQGLEFHSTMHHNDLDYRRNVDAAIRAVVKPHVERILKDYRVLFTNYIVKEPGPRSVVGVHQDWNYLDEGQFTSMNIWCPLVDTTAENGQLHALPGSHKLPTPIRYTPYRMPEYTPFFDAIKAHSLTLPLKAGQAVVYNSGLLHWSPPNHSDTVRPAIGFVNIPKEAQSLHYYRHPDKEDQLEVLEVDEEFYFTVKIGEFPEGYKSRGFIPYDGTSFSEKELLALPGIQKPSGGGLFKRIISAFSKG